MEMIWRAPPIKDRKTCDMVKTRRQEGNLLVRCSRTTKVEEQLYIQIDPCSTSPDVGPRDNGLILFPQALRPHSQVIWHLASFFIIKAPVRELFVVTSCWFDAQHLRNFEHLHYRTTCKRCTFKTGLQLPVAAGLHRGRKTNAASEYGLIHC